MTDNDTPNASSNSSKGEEGQNSHNNWSKSVLPPGIYQVSAQADSLHFQMMSPSCSGTNVHTENVKQAGDAPQANA